jgi:hypothetical protein
MTDGLFNCEGQHSPPDVCSNVLAIRSAHIGTTKRDLLLSDADCSFTSVSPREQTPASGASLICVAGWD